MTLRDAIYLCVGIVWGVLFVSMFWWAHVDDLKRVIGRKENIIRSLKK